MKLIYSVLFTIVSLVSFQSQVAIGKTTVQNGVSLEFGVGNKGLILPWVTNTQGTTVSLNPGATAKGGALVLDVAERKVKISTNTGTWSDFTVYSTSLSLPIVNTLQLSPNTENTSARAQIGTVTDTTPGILVLADTNKAMIPPLVNSPELNIQNPAPGMIVFDAAKKLFCVYNGTVWSYWKAE